MNRGDLSRTGLSERALAEIRAIFQKFPEVESATLYGSRAKGTHRTGSDLDITLHGADVTHATVLRVAGAFDESSLPYMADISSYETLTNAELREHITRVGLTLYHK